MNDSDEIVESQIYILHIKSKWLCIKSSFESVLRKPAKADGGLRSDRTKSFLKNRSGLFHKF